MRRARSNQTEPLLIQGFDVVGDEVGAEVVPVRVPGLIGLAAGSIVLVRAKDKATEL